jgi:hypothetical protein
MCRDRPRYLCPADHLPLSGHAVERRRALYVSAVSPVSTNANVVGSGTGVTGTMVVFGWALSVSTAKRKRP